jgi:peptide/nickel transport system substrate-binding protein
MRSLVIWFCIAVAFVGSAQAQKRGGVLVVSHIDSPPSPSIQEEGTSSVLIPFMAVFNNLVMYDQHKPVNTFDTIVPELAMRWDWDAARTALTFTLRQGVQWHDGKPFTSADVKCTWDMVSGLVPDKIRKSPRKEWWDNLEKITVNGDYAVTFHLKRPQPSFLVLLAAGWSPVYPCHVSSDAMRTKPIGTGPFRFVEFKRNESIRLARNDHYWKPGLPYLDGIEYKIILNRATRNLTFISGRVDMTFPTDVTAPLIKDIRSGAPTTQCILRPINANTNLILNRDTPPFNNGDLRMAVALSVDRAAFIKILSDGNADIGATMLPGPEGQWAMPAEMLAALPGYGPDVGKNRDAARALMRKHGYGPENRLKIKVVTRDIATYRDAALLMSDQLREIFIDGEVEPADTTQFYNRMFRKDYALSLNITGNSLDDPDQTFFENFGCGSIRNYANYCNRELQADFVTQSQEPDIEKRRQMVWAIERKLAEDVARPVIMHDRRAMCFKPYVRNVTVMTNSTYNGWRLEDVWLDR